MRKTMPVVYLCVCFWLVLGLPGLSYADTAEVLPKGVFGPELETYFFFPTTERYWDDRDADDIAKDYNQTLYLSDFIPEAPPLLIGTSDVSLEIKQTEFEFTLAYGVTDKLTAGVMIPYLILKNEVGVNLKDPGMNPDTGTDFSVEDIQDVLQSDYYGYKKFDTWSESGLGDIEAGFRYQYLKNDSWQLAFTTGVRLPTGDVDDPDDLASLSFGDGQYDLLFRLHNDYIGFKNLLLDFTFKYDLQLPDHEVRRVLEDVRQPLAPAANKEKVDRDLGDILEFEFSGYYTFREVFGISLVYSFAYKGEDSVSGDKGLAYSSLEDETEGFEHIIKPGLSFSTIPWYLKKTFPFPFSVSLEYRNKFAGRNVFKSEYISLLVRGFF